jgi:hypothetical protein
MTIEILTWNKPTHTSGRIYHRGSIKLKDNPIVDIMILNDYNKYHKIGEAELIENERGLFANNIKYGVDKEYLDKIVENSRERYLQENPNDLYYTELTIACQGLNKEVYEKENEVEFAFLYRQVVEDCDIKEIVRDLKINSLDNV